MSGLPKYHVNRSVLFVTYSLEEGMLLLANPLVELIIKTCLAHAQSHHPVRICHYVVEGNHIHFIMVVDNPDDIHGFAERFKSEFAHRINEVLGRQKRTVWCEGYDSPSILTAEDTIDKIVYIYTNPAKDNLVESIDSYPGMSSWKVFNDRELSKYWLYVPRSEFECLPDDRHNLKGYTIEAERLSGLGTKSIRFDLSPDAWMECFNIKDPEHQNKLRETIFRKVKAEELRLKEERIKAGKKVIGRDRLIHQPLNTTHRPTRDGRKMWCICWDIPRRIDFISTLKALVKAGKEVYRRWRQGDFSVSYPLGLYPPSIPKLASPLPALM